MSYTGFMRMQVRVCEIAEERTVVFCANTNAMRVVTRARHGGGGGGGGGGDL